MAVMSDRSILPFGMDEGRHPIPDLWFYSLTVCRIWTMGPIQEHCAHDTCIPHLYCFLFWGLPTPTPSARPSSALLSLPNPQPLYMILVHPLHTGFPPFQHLATHMALCYPRKESVTRDRTHDWLMQWHEVRLPPKALGASEGWRERAGRVLMEGTQLKTRMALCSGEMVFLC